MFARPSFRFTAILLAVFLLLIFVSLFENGLKSYTRNKISIISPPAHEPVSPPRSIKSFWAEWAEIFEQAKPQVGHIQVDNPVSIDSSDDGSGDRVPCPTNLGMSQQDVGSMTRSQKILLDKLKSFDKSTIKGMYSGTGVVTVAGGEFFPPAITSILMLRKTGSKLPVQVFLQNRKEYEIEICEDYLPTLNAECFVLEDFLREEAPFSITHYQLKALSILFSSFETILYLDSDCMPLRNPTEMLAAEPFTSTGLVIWPDYWIATEDPVFYKIAGLYDFPKKVPALSSEAGEILISKNQHIKSLLLASYYNVFGPSHFYPMLSQGAAGEGDKETFMAAAIVLGNPYYRVRTKVGTAGYHDEGGEFKGGAMIQHHAGDDYIKLHAKSSNGTTPIRPFFLHANMPKMNLGHLVDEGSLVNQKGEPLRLWGPKESQERIFGQDLERAVWNEMIESGCALQKKLEDWKERDKICDKARDHWNNLYRIKGRR